MKGSGLLQRLPGGCKQLPGHWLARFCLRFPTWWGLALFLLVSVAAGDAPSTITLRAIDNPETVEILMSVQRRVENIRGLRMSRPIPSYYFNEETLRYFLFSAIEKKFPVEDRRAAEAFLKSLRAIPEDMDLQEMYLALLSEQVGGFYEEEGKRLFVREDFDLAHSELGQLILVHEICHALQDDAFQLETLGLNDQANDDRGLAGLSLAEGDAMLAMGEYAARHGSPDMLKEIPKVMFSDQGALKDTPHFFRQLLVFPYLQGQVFLQEAPGGGMAARDAVFRDPPQTTEQILHPEKYFHSRDVPSSLSLLQPAGADWSLPPRPRIPEPPPGYRHAYLNRLGEAGLRALLEEPLGVGIAHDAAEGWDGDAYAVWTDDAGGWWFCLETAWDSEEDARRFQGAWVTLWRTISGERETGSLSKENQAFPAGSWAVTLERAGNRLVSTWGKGNNGQGKRKNAQ